MSPTEAASISSVLVGAGFCGCAGGACSVATGRSMIRPPGAGEGGGRAALLAHSAERRPGRLTAAGHRVQPRLPPVADARLVPHEEPDHHVDAAVSAGDCERLRQPAGLL